MVVRKVFEDQELRRCNLINFMRSRGLSNARLASVIDVSEVHISRILNGHRDLGKPTIRKLCRHFRLPSDYFDTTGGNELKVIRGDSSESLYVEYRWSQLCDALRNGGQMDEKYTVVVENGQFDPMFKAGDKLIVDSKIYPKTGDIALVESESVLILRRIRFSDDRTVLKSLNPSEDDIVLTGKAKKDLRILGTIIELRRTSL